MQTEATEQHLPNVFALHHVNGTQLTNLRILVNSGEGYSSAHIMEADALFALYSTDLMVLLSCINDVCRLPFNDNS